MLQSKLFTKTTREDPKDEVAKNARLLIRAGYIHKEMAGVYSYLPLGWRVLHKLEELIRQALGQLDAVEMLMPALHPKENWQTTGRWETMDDLFKLTDRREKEFALGPTHEEIVVPLLKNFVLSYQDLPRAVYQFQTKFRMEFRSKSGLLRGREFLMNDLYSFHRDQADLDNYYEEMAKVYQTIFAKLQIADLTYRTRAAGGTFSQYSDEFQTLTPAGEDQIYFCRACRTAINREIAGPTPKCAECGHALEGARAIEVGNIFKLRDKFTAAFGWQYRDANGKQQPVLMGCYGLGLSRLLGTVVEVLADEHGLVWPSSIAPFDIHILELGEASESAKTEKVRQELLSKLEKDNFSFLLDDRASSAGEKLADADLLGLPWREVISPQTLAAGQIEVKNRATGDTNLWPIADLQPHTIFK